MSDLRFDLNNGLRTYVTQSYSTIWWPNLQMIIMVTLGGLIFLKMILVALPGGHIFKSSYEIELENLKKKKH